MTSDMLTVMDRINELKKRFGMIQSTVNNTASTAGTTETSSSFQQALDAATETSSELGETDSNDDVVVTENSKAMAEKAQELILNNYATAIQNLTSSTDSTEADTTSLLSSQQTTVLKSAIQEYQKQSKESADDTTKTEQIINTILK